MRFRLLDKDMSSKVHEGIVPRMTAPRVITWGSRAFIHDGFESDVALYREADAFRIGTMFS